MKWGIALGGGGAKGVAHIGVLSVLEAAGVPIEIVTGTSAGAIVGALYAAGKSPDEIRQIIRRLTLRQWLARDRTGMGLFSTDGVRRLIEAEIGAGACIEDLPRKFAAVAVDMDSQQEVVFDAGLVADAVCASAAFPGILAPVQIAGRWFLDGGLLNPVPVDAARQLGAARVIAVDLAADEPLLTSDMLQQGRRDALFFRFISTTEQQKLFRVAVRSIGIMCQQIRLAKAERCPPEVTIRPEVEKVGLVDFDLAEVALAAGETAARAALPQIERLMAPSARERLRGGWRKITRRRGESAARNQ